MGDLDGITCFCELAVPLASRLCERLGLPTNSPQVGGLCSEGWGSAVKGWGSAVKAVAVLCTLLMQVDGRGRAGRCCCWASLRPAAALAPLRPRQPPAPRTAPTPLPARPRPFPLAQAVDSARDKHATRAVMEEAGLPTPRNMLITSRDVLERVRAAACGQARGWPPCANRKLQAALAAGSLPAEACAGAGEEWGHLCQPGHPKLLCGSHKPNCSFSLLQAADHVGFPAVIKPIHGAASLGVLRVDSKESLATAYDKARQPALGPACAC